MKYGKIQPAVLDRSVLRVLKLSGAGGADLFHGSDGSAAPAGAALPSVITACAGGPVGGRTDLTIEMILTEAVNNLAAAGAVCRSLQTCVLLPENIEESSLKDLMKRCAAFAVDHGLQIIGGDTAVSDAVVRPVLSVTAYGTTYTQLQLSESCSGPAEKQPADAFAVVMTGYTGCGGTAILAGADEKALRQRFPGSLVDRALAMNAQLGCMEEALAAYQSGAVLLHDISRGGVFAALWELSQRVEKELGMGLDIELHALPIRQETIEICEIYDLNPYQLFGQGALLAVTPYPEEFLRLLQKQGKTGRVIGHLASGRGCRIRNGEDTRYLEKPQQDSIFSCHFTQCSDKV